jgi:hypothetical protein
VRLRPWMRSSLGYEESSGASGPSKTIFSLPFLLHLETCPTLESTSSGSRRKARPRVISQLLHIG